MTPQCFVRSVPGRRDTSGVRLYYTPSLRRYDAGIMELGLVYTPIMAVPPRQRAFDLAGYCNSKCTQTVRIHTSVVSWALGAASLVVVFCLPCLVNTFEYTVMSLLCCLMLEKV